jgi:hypothetical protein
MSLRGRKNFLVGLSISSSAGVPAIRGDAAFGSDQPASTTWQQPMRAAIERYSG